MSQEDDLFRRCGPATLTLFKNKKYQEIWKILEEKQALFLDRQTDFRSPRYKWPSDSLHNWSRIWEYPFVYFQIEKYLQENKAELSQIKIADVGSGVTFFPFAIAELGTNVVCFDPDPVVSNDIPKAAKALGYTKNEVTVGKTDGHSLDAEDNSLDCIACVSVLEHVKNWNLLIEEFRRVLKVNGMLILTIDLGLNQFAEIQPDRHKQLITDLMEKFELLYPFQSTHPAELLTSRSSRYPIYPWAWHWRRIYLRMQLLAWKLLGIDKTPYLACEGLVFVKK